jgi:ATP-dependent helicase HrpB
MSAPDSPAKADDALSMAVLAGFPDRVARRLRPGGRALSMAGGGTAELSEESVVRHAPWLVAVDAEERRGVVVRLASGIEPEWLLDLFPDRIEERDEVRWNESAERVESTSRMLYDGLVLGESKGRGDDAATAQALFEAALAKGIHHFAKEDALERWLARSRFVAETTGAIAPLTDAEVHAALRLACDGKASFAELKSVSLVDLLRGTMGADAAKVDRFAPDRISLASGRSAKVEYEAGKPPWVEAHLQDFFGTLETPKVCGDRVALVVHLLGPNKRAVQITTDLAGFWQRHYPAVRKELMRKYPRHYWPENPAEAEARLRVPKK